MAATPRRRGPRWQGALVHDVGVLVGDTVARGQPPAGPRRLADLGWRVLTARRSSATHRAVSRGSVNRRTLGPTATSHCRTRARLRVKDLKWIVQPHDQLDAGQRHIEPLSVCSVQDPLMAIADRLDASALLVTRHLDPAGAPGEVVNGMPRNSGDHAELFGQRCLARTGHAVEEDPAGIAKSITRAHPLRLTTSEVDVRLWTKRTGARPQGPLTRGDEAADGE